MDARRSGHTVAVVIAATVAAGGTAQAGPRKPGMYGGVELGGDVAAAGGRSGPGVAFGGHVGWVLGDAARFGVEAEVQGGEAWLDGVTRVDGVLLAGARIWLAERVPLTVALGVAGGDAGGVDEGFVGAGAAAGATLGVELRRWNKSALSLRAVAFGGRFDDGRATHVGLTLGLDWFGLTAQP